jgi:LemA protein
VPAWIAFGALFLFGAALYNTMVRRRNRVRMAAASVDVMLKRRWDLIPNLVEAVKGYAAHERAVLEAVTAARARALSAPLSLPEKASLDRVVAPGIRTLVALAEGYPELKASEGFLRLQGALNEAEEQVAAARRAYNAAVTSFNDGCGTFPLRLAAAAMGLEPMELFEAAPPERDLPSGSTRDGSAP